MTGKDDSGKEQFAMKRSTPLLALLAAVLAVLLLLTLPGCGVTNGGRTEKELSGVEELSGSPPYEPVFTDPAEKLRELSSREFTRQLFNEALAFEPLLGTTGTQVHMGYWSGPGNHGTLVKLLDAINASSAEPPQKAIWDEGATSSNQYPSYVRMLEEHWYERSDPVDGKVTIYGRKYTDPHSVTFEQADEIWGRYSQRYADMAELLHRRTGKPVKAWCFVAGAKANRIFYTYELPRLRELEQAGDVQVFFAGTTEADWNNPDDWTEGAANAPEPLPAQ